MVAYEPRQARCENILHRQLQPISTRAGALDPLRKGKTTVMVVDDHAIVCDGVNSLLSSHGWLILIGQAADGREGLLKAKQLQPDLVVVDVNLPKLSGLALIKALRSEVPQTKAILFSMHTPDQFAQNIVESGVLGYVCKRDASTKLVKALEAVALGETFFDPDFTRLLSQTAPEKSLQPAVTPREHEVLVGVAEGLSNKEIAARLGLGVRTIETYRVRLVRKLNIRSAASLTRFAIQQGLLSS